MCNAYLSFFFWPGGPYTIGEAQNHLMASAIKDRVTFITSDPLTYLASTSTMYSTAVLCHSIWYFASPAVLLDILRALSTRANRICVGEWSLVASDLPSFLHVLAALTEASLECHKQDSISNIRTVLSPQRITDMARGVGLVLERQVFQKTPEHVVDARYDVFTVLNSGFAREIEDNVKDEREKAAINALRDATRSTKGLLAENGVGISCMDVWCAVFVVST